MSMQGKSGTTNRRDFLKLATTSAGAAAAVAVMAPEDAEAAAQADGDGLRDTAHTRAYLDSARF